MLAHNYLDSRQMIDSVTKITEMFTEKAMHFPMFVAFEQAQMNQYLSMLKTDILQFVSTQRYGSLVELHEAVRRWEIEMELHKKE